jgi:hypothetical protein
MAKKRLGTMFLSLLVVVGLIAGCSDSGSKTEEKSTETGTKTTDTKTEATTESAYPDYSKGFPEKVELNIPVYERAFEGWNVSEGIRRQIQH